MKTYGVHFGYWGDDYNPEQFADHLNQVRSTGAQAFEVRPADAILRGDHNGMLDLRRMAEEAGIGLIFSFSFVRPAKYDILSESSETRRKAVDFLKRLVEGTSLAGGQSIGGVLYSSWPSVYGEGPISHDERLRRIGRSIDSMREVAKAAEDNNIIVNLEVVNRFENYIINTAQEGVAFCKQVASPNCRLLLDVFHMNIEEENISLAIRSANGYIGHFHVSEPNRGIPHISSRINWQEIGDALNAINYDGCISIESMVHSAGKAAYNMHMWRNLTDDVSLENRLNMLKEGVSFLKSQIGE
jgi:D-psicose/D-tagatose/L-ribulose 3-epimerase